MTAITFRTDNVAFLGRRTVARCHLCRLDIGHYALPSDARAEAEIHLRKYHQETTWPN